MTYAGLSSIRVVEILIQIPARSDYCTKKKYQQKLYLKYKMDMPIDILPIGRIKPYKKSHANSAYYTYLLLSLLLVVVRIIIIIVPELYDVV